MFNLKITLKTFSQLHSSPFRVATDLSGPVADDKGGYTQADDEVDVDDAPQVGLLLQRTLALLRRRGSLVSILFPLHPAQPVEGRLPPGLSLD